MKINVLKGTNQIGGAYTEIKSSLGRILVDFGEDLNDTKEKLLPNIEGLTYGEPRYDAVFITHYHRRSLWTIE